MLILHLLSYCLRFLVSVNTDTFSCLSFEVLYIHPKCNIQTHSQSILYCYDEHCVWINKPYEQM